MSHEKRRLVERVSYITSPGHGDGTDGWRRRNGLRGGGPAAVVTTMCVLRFPEEGGEAYLASVHPGCSVADVSANTGWKLNMRGEVAETPAPTAAELEWIRRLDPDGHWTRRAAPTQ
jgi:glutaconate CoA-transferase subunit B